MPAPKFDTLRSIFSMMAPVDLIGVQKNVLGLTDIDSEVNNVEDLLRKMHDPDGAGALPSTELLTAFSNALNGVSDVEKVKQYFKAVRLYCYTNGSTTVPTSSGIDWHEQGYDFGINKVAKFNFESLVLAENIDTLKKNNVSVITSNSNFLEPGRHQIENAELFMNFIPTHIMSRCVPYLDVVFSFSGRSFKDNGYSRPGLMRFLLGGAEGSPDPTSANRAMLDGQLISEGTTPDGEPRFRSTMGMEAFTSPQTLVNPEQQWNKNRYNNVQDPFRPLASIESCTINVQSTIGWATKKVATLVMKLHDRSRMAELAEFIRPAAYTRTKITLTWGWRHPVEPNNPYADFINRTMLVRENFDVMNVNYSFDNVGQVIITLQLSYKGERALEEIVLGSLKSTFDELKRAVERIQSLRKDLGLDDETGISKDVQGYQILEAGSTGNLPEIAPGKAQKLLASLDSYLKQGKFDKAGSEELIKELQSLYVAGNRDKGEGPAAFKKRLDAAFDSATGELFRLWQKGPDPWLMTNQIATLRKDQMGADNLPSSRFPALVDNIDEANNPNAERNKRIGKKKPPPKQKLASFGKVFVSTMLQAVMKSDMAQDIQFYFYRVNHLAGPASGINLAEFPIDLDRLKEDLSKHLSRSRSDRITVVNFLNLLVNTQLRDIFTPAYGLTEYKQQFDPKNKNKKGKSKNNYQGTKGGDQYESVGALRRAELGNFVPPVIEMMMENVSASEANKPEGESAAQTMGRSTNSILKIHVYDKNVNIYPHATMLLKAGDSPDAERFYASVDALNELKKLKDTQFNSFSQILKSLGQAGIEVGDGMNYVIAGGQSGEPEGFGVTNQKRIKELVAATHPTIIIGGNASNVTQANLASKVNSLISTGLLRGGFAGRGEVMNKNGSGPGGLPLRVLPANMTLTALGCPLLRNNQRWFIDFNTGTNVDTIYILTQLTHTLTPGKFESNATFTYWDAYGRYEAPVTAVKALRGIEVPKEVPDEEGKKK